MSNDDYPADWERRRERVFNQMGEECSKCGVPRDLHNEKYSEDIHIHHIEPISCGGSHDIDNLTPLCKKCHAFTHGYAYRNDIESLEWYPCAYCNEMYLNEESHAGSFCSEYCHAYHKAEKQQSMINADRTICSTCFNNVKGDEACGNCGNWDVNQFQSELAVKSEPQVLDLVAFVLKQTGQTD